MAAVGLASKKIFIYNLEGGPQFVKEIESQLKYQVAYYSICSAFKIGRGVDA